jgi:hypothetical protein
VIFALLLLAAGPNLTVTVKAPERLVPGMQPWLTWAAEVLPGLHPTQLKRTLRPIDPLDPATWPKGARSKTHTYRGDDQAWLALVDGGPPEVWPLPIPRHLPTRSGPVGVRLDPVPGWGGLQGNLDPQPQTLAYDLDLKPENDSFTNLYVPRGVSKRFMEHPGAVGEWVGSGLSWGPIEGGVQVLLLEDGSLLVALRPGRGRILELEAQLAAARLQSRRLGEGLVTGWVSDPSVLEGVGPAIGARGGHAVSAWVTPHRLLTSLARRSRLDGPRPKGAEVALVELAYGRALAGLERVELALDRTAKGLRARGKWVRREKNP